MKQVFVNSVASISPQHTIDNSLFLNDVVSYNDTVIPVINPNYKDYIPPAAARRMAKGIKMGVVASKLAIQEAGLETVDAIITGTGMGCLRDSEKFLTGILDNDEQFLTPTSFIQSTHNTVGGQIALGMQCKGYNFTYVHASASFESALLDAKLQIGLNEAETILVGGVDELADHTVKIHKLIHHIKAENVNNLELLKSQSKGAVFSEGANFFVLSDAKHNNSYAELVDVQLYNTLSVLDVEQTLQQFLSSNGLSVNDIDAVVLGNNGDVEYDVYYNTLKKAFEGASQLYYKHMSGEFHTASSFGFWVASKLLKEQSCPDVLRMNAVKNASLKNVLLYNQYRGENHSFTLLRKC